MENTTLTYLYSKTRNRLAKVLYIFLYLIIILCIYVLTIAEGEGHNSEFFMAIFITIIIFEAIKRAFYYVGLGTIWPKK
jgi:uncharacterized BrkB/YihY/UPF0761 family membrane protein